MRRKVFLTEDTVKSSGAGGRIVSVGYFKKIEIKGSEIEMI